MSNEKIEELMEKVDSLDKKFQEQKIQTDLVLKAFSQGRILSFNGLASETIGEENYFQNKKEVKLNILII